MRRSPSQLHTQDPARKRSFFRPGATLILALTLAALFGLRAHLVEAVVGAYTGCIECMRLPAMGHDAWLLGAALGVLACAWLVKSPLLQVLLRLVFVALVVVAAVDVVLFGLLTQRLHLADVLRFGGEAGANWSVLRASLDTPFGWLKAVTAATLTILMVMAALPDKVRPRLAAQRGSAAALCVVASLAIQNVATVRYVHSALTRNVVEMNLSESSRRAFSPEFIEGERRKLDGLPEICEENMSPRRPNVIVVLAESLSAWHSELLGGPADWTPRLDAIARENHYFTHFYANGFSTSGAEVAVGSGQVAMNPPGMVEHTFNNYATDTRSLPVMATRAGYESQFFTPGDTGFLGVGKWLRKIGFNEVNGSEEEWYEGLERWQFKAVADADFYRRYLAWLDARDKAKPFVSVLLNVTSHPPFVNPLTHSIDPEGSFRYVDEQLGKLHDELRQRGFFRDGILIIMGDHRTMTPLDESEYVEFGDRAFARVPMIVIGDVEMPAVVTASFQQIDLLPSLAWQFGVDWCRSPFTGSFLRAVPQPPQVVIHARGDDRNQVNVYHGTDEVSVYLLDGDDSRWLGSPPPDGDLVAAWINVQREDAARRGIQQTDAPGNPD